MYVTEFKPTTHVSGLQCPAPCTPFRGLKSDSDGIECMLIAHTAMFYILSNCQPRNYTQWQNTTYSVHTQTRRLV